MYDAQATRLDDRHPAAPHRHDSGALERREEARDALARGAGQLGEVGLGHPHRDPVAVLGDRLLGDELVSTPATRLGTV